MTDGLLAERDAFAARGLADPGDDWLGSAGAFVDRALERHRQGWG
jgi:hypothetical protein